MMHHNRRDRISNGRNGDHVSIIDPNCQRRVLDRSCDFHAVNFGQEQKDSNTGQVTHFSEHASNADGAKIHQLLGVETLKKIEFVLHLYCR